MYHPLRFMHHYVGKRWRIRYRAERLQSPGRTVRARWELGLPNQRFGFDMQESMVRIPTRWCCRWTHGVSPSYLLYFFFAPLRIPSHCLLYPSYNPSHCGSVIRLSTLDVAHLICMLSDPPSWVREYSSADGTNVCILRIEPVLFVSRRVETLEQSHGDK